MWTAAGPYFINWIWVTDRMDSIISFEGKWLCEESVCGAELCITGSLQAYEEAVLVTRRLSCLGVHL